jgi:transcriptional regulator with XRE-family HTH domain
VEEGVPRIIAGMERLKELRIDANMTQEGLAAATDLTQSTISRLERGGR